MSQPQNNENVITVRRLMRALSSLWDKFTAALSTKANLSDFQNLQGFTNRLKSAAVAAMERLETVETYPFAKQVFTLIVDDTLFVAAPKGYILQTDEVVFGRYLRTFFRNIDPNNPDGGRITNFIKKGWTVPYWFKKIEGTCSHHFITLHLSLVDENSESARLIYLDDKGFSHSILPHMLNFYDVFEVHTEAWDGDTSTAADLLDFNGCYKNNSGTRNNAWHPLNLVDYRLGIRIYRKQNGYNRIALTDWLPFRLRPDKDENPRLCRA